MKVLILGSGAREHAIAWKFSKSNRISGLFIAPGNAGTGEIGENLWDVDPEKSAEVIAACREHEINLVFVGPEAPLSAGIVDALQKEGISVIGPHQEAARLESSKEFSKDFMLRHGIPTAAAVTVTNKKELEKIIKQRPGKVVIKKNGLASGKGVLESDATDELLSFGHGILKQKDSLLVEEFLSGYEISVFTMSDGKTYCILPTTADFKKAGEGDTGPNTGGMGAICPVPVVGKQLLSEIEETIIQPTFRGLEKDGLMYKGVLYFGLMITDQGPKVLEYNVRFGDPECQVLLPLIESDFGDFCDSIAKENLENFPLAISQKSALCVVIASGGYPAKYSKGKKVKPLPHFPEKDCMIFHASTKSTDDHTALTGGGRCFSVVGLGPNLTNASLRAYEAAPQVKFDGAWYRKDIGQKFFMDTM
ncbi:MAG: phosphoribosylamine--glycine ligase [Spirochaetales bacterium]|nr:phosphoribosylamine--glycine ligase [Spirochaetales bacterium]